MHRNESTADARRMATPHWGLSQSTDSESQNITLMLYWAAYHTLQSQPANGHTWHSCSLMRGSTVAGAAPKRVNHSKSHPPCQHAGHIPAVPSHPQLDLALHSVQHTTKTLLAAHLTTPGTHLPQHHKFIGCQHQQQKAHAAAAYSMLSSSSSNHTLQHLTQHAVNY